MDNESEDLINKLSGGVSSGSKDGKSGGSWIYKLIVVAIFAFMLFFFVIIFSGSDSNGPSMPPGSALNQVRSPNFSITPVAPQVSSTPSVTSVPFRPTAK